MERSDFNLYQSSPSQGQRGALPPELSTRPLSPILPQPVPTGQNVTEAADVLTEQYLIFSLLNREFAIKAECIQGVERLGEVTHVPNVVSWVKGVVNLRGSIVSIVDFRAFLELETIPTSPRTLVLMVQYNQMVICFIVDSVGEMIPIPIHAISNLQGTFVPASVPQWIAPYAAASAVLNTSTGAGKRTVVLLDPARLLFSDKIQHYQTLE